MSELIKNFFDLQRFSKTVYLAGDNAIGEPITTTPAETNDGKYYWAKAADKITAASVTDATTVKVKNCRRSRVHSRTRAAAIPSMANITPCLWTTCKKSKP